MGFEIFGFTIQKKTAKEELRVLELDSDQGGATTITTAEGSPGMTFEAGVQTGLDADSAMVPADEVEKIRKYREIAMTSEVDEALTEIRNEVFIFDVPGKRAFDIDFSDDDDKAPSPAIQKKIVEQFAYLYDITDFHDRGIEYFNHWYVDSRIHFQKVVDQKKPQDGIKKIQFLEPLNIRKVRVVKKDPATGTIDLNKIVEYFIYARKFDPTMKFGVTNVVDYESVPGSALKIRSDAICTADSGLRDANTGKIIGYLDKAIVPYNNLKMMEDSMVIFRVVRAPQRRAIYVDVGQLQKNKADSYMKEIMARFKNRMTYDAKTGMLSDRRNVMSMIEDYWLPRREGGKGTEITTLDGQDASGALEEVEYYRDKLWRALGVPRSRFGENAQSFVFGKGIEIQRDEYRFKKFLDNLRRYFLEWFEDLLKTQLVLKKIITEDEWDDIRRTFFWTFAEDNAFVEYKESEIINNRINTLAAIDPYVGKYFTVDWVRKKVLRQTDLEIKAENDQMAKEEKEGIYDKEVDENGNTLSDPRYFNAPNGRTTTVQPSGTDDGASESETVSKKSVTVTTG